MMVTKIAETVFLFSVVLALPGLFVALLSPKWGVVAIVAIVPLGICVTVGISILLFRLVAFVRDSLVEIWRR